MTNVNRVQAGVPTGGQFAESTHAEADVVLGPGAPTAKPGDGLAGHDLAELRGRVHAAKLAAAEANRELADESASQMSRMILARHPEAAFAVLEDSNEEYNRVNLGDILDENMNPIDIGRRDEMWLDGNAAQGTSIFSMAGNLDTDDEHAGWHDHVVNPNFDAGERTLDLRRAAGRGGRRRWVQDLTSAGDPSGADVIATERESLRRQRARAHRRDQMLATAEMAQRVRGADPNARFLDVCVDDEFPDELQAMSVLDAEGQPHDHDHGGVGDAGDWKNEDGRRPDLLNMVRDLDPGSEGTWKRYAEQISEGTIPVWRIDLLSATGAHLEDLS